RFAEIQIVLFVYFLLFFYDSSIDFVDKVKILIGASSKSYSYFYVEKKNFAQIAKIDLDFSGQKSKKSHFDSLVLLVLSFTRTSCAYFILN
ncbi:hypothetical protein BpHYR1_050619, partial [Brachionus plicatilis]